MPWLLGVDEAGYGPNLGPFVMTAVACRVPDALRDADLWDVLRAAVRRPPEPDDGRVVIGDSKAVYTPSRGLRDLEAGALAPQAGPPPAHLGAFLQTICSAGLTELQGEAWFAGARPLPVAGAACGNGRFVEASAANGLTWGPVRSVVVCPARFNRLLDRWGGKGAVLGEALAELLGHARTLPDDEPLHVVCDKHGGRNCYSAMLQDAFPDGFVQAREERMARSSYRVVGLDREVWLTFQPRADAEHFGVALASMVSKYLRELLMLDFNDFWQRHVPGLKPTAGYPLDAARFFAAIRALLPAVGLAEEQVWRRK